MSENLDFILKCWFAFLIKILLYMQKFIKFAQKDLPQVFHLHRKDIFDAFSCRPKSQKRLATFPKLQ
jgi:hypothetical protein